MPENVSTITHTMHILKIIALSLFALFLPLLLLSSNLRFIVSEPYLYEYGFDEYHISEVTGIEDDELTRVARELIHYLNSDEDSAQIEVTKNGSQMRLFNERELLHMEDVKVIIQLFYTIQWVTLTYTITFLIAGFFILKRAFLIRIAQGCILGGIVTFTVFAVFGLWALIDFDGLFLQFHLTSFSNDLWKLDPSTDYLIMMFPEAFFSDAAFFLIGGTILEAAILGCGSAVYLWRKKRLPTSCGMKRNCLLHILNRNCLPRPER